MPPYLSLALGSVEETLWDMTSAYTAFPNQGVRMRPYSVISIADRRSIAEAEALLRQVRTTSARFFDVLAAAGTSPGLDRHVALSELGKLMRYQRRFLERRDSILKKYNPQ
jgi:membrane carboxypeptidase/penicillin-binding protein